MPGPDTRLPSIRDRAAKVLASARARLPARRPSRRTLVRTGAVVGGVLVALILFLGLFDWNYLKGPVERIASSRTGRVVQIDGDLDVKILSWTPGADIHGLRISNPAWVVGGGDMARIERLQVKARLLPLFRGRVVLPLLKVDNPQIAQRRNFIHRRRHAHHTFAVRHAFLIGITNGQRKFKLGLLSGHQNLLAN